MWQTKNSKSVLLRLVIVVMFVCLGSKYEVYAQSMLNNTYFTPMTFSNKKTPASFNFSNGNSFRGSKITYYTNNKETGSTYHGTLYFTNGDKLMTMNSGEGFDGSFNFKNGYCYYLISSGTLYSLQYRNGVKVYEQQVHTKYYIKDYCIHFYANGSTMDYGSGGSSSSGSSSKSGSSYNRHEARCMGCNGTGYCGRCGGSGLVNNRTCGLCNGNRRCKNCGGTGKKHGVY